MIKQVQIYNYKSIREATIALQPINILVGCNGAGKSNFISFFELLRKIYQQRLGEYVVEHGGADKLLYHGAKVSQQIDGLFNFDDQNAFFFSLKPAVNNKLYIATTGDYFNSHSDHTQAYKQLWDQTTWDNSVEESEISRQKAWRAGYIKQFLDSFTVYHFHDTSISSPMRKPCSVEDNLMLRHDASNLAAFLYKLQAIAPTHFAMIESVVRSVAPYFKCFNLRPSELSPTQISLVWEEVGSDMYLDATSLSDGTLRFIALAALLLQPTPPQTLIIDEPELGLHPSAINKLSGLIKRAAANGAQVIVATQSVNLVNNFSPADILVSERGNGQSIFRHLETDSLAEWLDAYSIGTLWEKNVIGGRP